MSFLRALQGGLEGMYRVSTSLDVADFMIDEAGRRAFSAERAPGEQLFVREDHDGLSVSLFVDEAALGRLDHHDPRRCLDERNLPDFLLALEGVSHFVYLASRMQHERPVSAVELELQAEVDKFAVALLVGWDQTGAPSTDLRERLFRRIRYLPDLSADERSRYLLANEAANDYCRSLEQHYVRRRAAAELLVELRRFYQQDLAGKLDRVTALRAA
ncbi:MAG: hypothetical protein ABI321_22335 [Polyangia bacterium]